MAASESSTTGMESRKLSLLAGGAAVWTGGVMAVVGVLAIDHPLFGVVAGLLGGPGSYLTMQYILAGNFTEERMEELRSNDPAAGEQVTGGVHGGAAGFALEMGAVGTLAAGFSLEDRLLIPILGVLAAVLVAYVVLERILPRPRD